MTDTSISRQGIRTMTTVIIALIAGFLVHGIPFAGMSEAASRTLGIFTVATILWILEPFPLYVTSFIIVFLEVVFLGMKGGPLGFTGKEYTAFLHPFFDTVVVLFLGGFVMARAVKRYGLDEYIARTILIRIGSNPPIVLLGMMVTTAVLSMWISNTATTALMITVAVPIVRSFPKDEPFRKAIILGIPFASNIGGIGTPIGTPPNAIAMGILGNLGHGISFLQWMLMGLPVVIVLLALCWRILCMLFPARISRIEIAFAPGDSIDKRATIILCVFGLVVVLWLTTSVHGIPSAIISLIPFIFFFGFGFLDDDDLSDLGWGILFIIGGGMSLGVAMNTSGLSEWIVNQIPFSSMGRVGILFAFAGAGVIMTTFISNSATANLLIPIVVGISAISPIVGAVVVAFTSSAAMILPISTPPNAIAYGSKLIDVRDMVRAGAVVTVIAALLIPIFLSVIL